MKRIRRFWRDYWQLLVLVAVCVAAVAWLLLYRLGSLTGGLSSMELQLQVSSSVWHNIVHDPLNIRVLCWQLTVNADARRLGREPVFTNLPADLIDGVQ